MVPMAERADDQMEELDARRNEDVGREGSRDVGAVREAHGPGSTRDPDGGSGSGDSIASPRQASDTFMVRRRPPLLATRGADAGRVERNVRNEERGEHQQHVSRD